MVLYLSVTAALVPARTLDGLLALQAVSLRLCRWVGLRTPCTLHIGVMSPAFSLLSPWWFFPSSSCPSFTLSSVHAAP